MKTLWIILLMFAMQSCSRTFYTRSGTVTLSHEALRNARKNADVLILIQSKINDAATYSEQHSNDSITVEFHLTIKR